MENVDAYLAPKPVTVEMIPKKALPAGQSGLDIKLYNENHTVGNILTDELLKDPNVTFSSYLEPHPTSDHIVLKVICKSSFRNQSADSVVTQAIDRIDQDLTALSNAVSQIALRKPPHME
ncbi:hypothetical protein PCE1_001756 [Barthelona sp. PCE]